MSAKAKKVVVTVSDLRKQAEVLQAKLIKLLEKEVAQSESALKKGTKSVDSLNKKIQTAKTRKADLIAKGKKKTTQFTKTADALKTLSEQSKELKDQFKGIQADLKAAKQALKNELTLIKAIAKLEADLNKPSKKPKKAAKSKSVKAKRVVKKETAVTITESNSAKEQAEAVVAA